MPERALHFVDIPDRSIKPRKTGLTLARDLGFGYVEAQSWMESVGEFIDYMKIRHLWVLLMSESSDDLTRRKIKLYREHGVEVNPGGIVFEMAYLSNAVEKTFESLVKLGFTAVECSENIIPLTLDEKVKYVRMAKDFGLKVLFEVGDKYPEDKFDAKLAASEMKTLIGEGCDLCILERSQIEICLGPKADNPEGEKLIQLVNEVGLDRVVFEAEASPHQVWLFKNFGPDVNLGPNLDKTVIERLEPTRRTLSREGGYDYLIDKVNQRTAAQ